MLGYCRSIMKHKILLIAILGLLFSTSCMNKNSPATAKTADEPVASLKNNGTLWYYFSDSGIHPAQNPSDIPARTFVPWTEAVRVSDAAIVNKIPSLLINRLGLMTSGTGNGASALHTDSLFSSNTAAAIYNTGTETGIRLYRNSFFSGSGNSAAGGAQETSVCIARYNPETGTFSVALKASDLELPENAQCVALDRIGSMWYAAFKYEKDSKVQFSYLEFESFPERKEGSGPLELSGIRKISSETYQKSVAPFSFPDAPDSLKSVLSGLPQTTAFNLRVYTPVSKSAQTYARGNDHAGETKVVDGTAFVSDEKTAVLFADGTFYYRRDNTAEKTQILQLPVLSNGYVYTNFILTGKSLLVAWEEQRFFETGRAGLLEISIPDAVY